MRTISYTFSPEDPPIIKMRTKKHPAVIATDLRWGQNPPRKNPPCVHWDESKGCPMSKMLSRNVEKKKIWRSAQCTGALKSAVISLKLKRNEG
jgi:hypothetical protein